MMPEWLHEPLEVLQLAARSRRSQGFQDVLQVLRLVPVRRQPEVKAARLPRDPQLAWDRPGLGLLEAVAQQHRQECRQHCRRHPVLRLVLAPCLGRGLPVGRRTYGLGASCP